MSRYDDDDSMNVFWGVATLLSVVIAIVVYCVDCNHQRDCEARGGTVERYNYRTILVPISCGKGCTTIVPEEISDWRCVGGRAEKP